MSEHACVGVSSDSQVLKLRKMRRLPGINCNRAGLCGREVVLLGVQYMDGSEALRARGEANSVPSQVRSSQVLLLGIHGASAKQGS